MVKEILKRRPRFIPSRRGDDLAARVVPQNMWISCPRCHELLYAKEFEDGLRVCPKCSYHDRLGARERLATLLDGDSFEELDAGLSSRDPLDFRAGDRVYADKLAADRAKTGMAEALIYGRGLLDGLPVVIAVHNFAFRGGSMGVVVGEKLARAIELAAGETTPLIVVSASGGARMEEGVFSLMQMAKATAALDRLSAAQTPYISLLTDPTVGGVPASYAMLGDVNIAEPGAHIHFAGARVVEQTTRQKGGTALPTAEFMLRHGMIDLVVPRGELRSTLARLLRIYGAHCYQPGTRHARPAASSDGVHPNGLTSARDVGSLMPLAVAPPSGHRGEA